ncbi:MAG: hypothetical protein P8106_00695, partial [Gammaproteobacteria bacterium]
MKLARRLLKALAWLSAAMAATPVLALALLTTEPGTRWALQQAAKFGDLAGISVQFDDVSGNLLYDITISGLRVRFGDSLFEAAALHLRWRPAALRHRLLHIEALALTSPRYVGGPGEDAAAGPPSIPELGLPLAVRLDRLALTDLTVAQGDGRFALARAGLAARLGAERWSVTGLELEAEGYGLAGDLALQPTAPHALAGTLTGWFQAPDQPRLRARLSVAGAALAPRLAVEVTEPAALRADATLALAEPEPRFDAVATWPRLAWPISGEATYWAEQGRLAVAGT